MGGAEAVDVDACGGKGCVTGGAVDVAGGLGGTGGLGGRGALGGTGAFEGTGTFEGTGAFGGTGGFGGMGAARGFRTQLPSGAMHRPFRLVHTWHRSVMSSGFLTMYMEVYPFSTQYLQSCGMGL